MKKTETITQERIRELLDYDPETGIFRWKENRRGGRGIQPGMRAGSVKPTNVLKDGTRKLYRYVRVDGVDVLAKRLAWFWTHDYWPTYLRCLDGNEDNCALANLVDAGKVPSLPNEERFAQRRRYYQLTRDRQRDIGFRTKFGITLADYWRMAAEQGNVCAICYRPEFRTRHGKVRWLCVDHHHSNGKVRGLLCCDCNQGLGRFGDSIERLRAAVEYLERDK